MWLRVISRPMAVRAPGDHVEGLCPPPAGITQKADLFHQSLLLQLGDILGHSGQAQVQPSHNGLLGQRALAVEEVINIGAVGLLDSHIGGNLLLHIPSALKR